MGRWSLLLIVSLASFLTPFVGSSVNVVIPVIGVEFRVDPVLLSWFSTSTLLASALFFLPVGVYGDRRGRLWIFRGGLIIFTVSVFAAALAPSEWFFLVLRFLQGVGSAAISTAGVAIISEVFANGERGFALGVNISSVYLGLTLGPFVGGLVSSLVGWRYLFLLISLVASVAVVVSYRELGLVEELEPGRFDYVGSVVLAFTFAFLVLGLSIYPSPWAFPLLLLFLLAGSLFIFWEGRAPNPLIDLGYLLGNRLLLFSVVTSLLAYTASYASSFLINIYLQYVLGLTPFVAGLILTSRSVVMALLSAFMGKLSDVVQPRIIVSLGLAMYILAYLLLAGLDLSTPISLIVVALVMLGLGSALFSSPNTNAIMSSVGRERLGLASGLVGAARVYGQTFSMSIVSLVFSLYVGGVEVSAVDPADLVVAISRIFIVFAAVASVAILSSMGRGRVNR